jgi:hypothetical protein
MGPFSMLVCPVAMHMLGLWFCQFANFSLTRRVAVLNISVPVGAAAPCLAVGQQWEQQLP